jgi:hypothetical protein
LREEVYAEKVLIKIDPEIKNSPEAVFRIKRLTEKKHEQNNRN